MLTVPQGHRQTDRQTDGRTHGKTRLTYDSNTAAPRGKNRSTFAEVIVKIKVALFMEDGAYIHR